MDNKDSELIGRAKQFASNAHQGQVRKFTGNSYFLDHCCAVAQMVAAKGGTNEMIAAAYLHDTVEDCDVLESEIRQEFGDAVASLVNELTDKHTKASHPELNRKQRAALDAERWKTASDEAKAIKLCDMQDNCSSVLEHDPSFAKVYFREKADVLEAMGY